MDLIHPLTEEQINLFFNKIKYSEQQLKLDLVYIKEWLKQQEHLPPAKLTEKEEFLRFFLIGCKGNLDKTKLKLDAYYTWRSKSEIFDKRDPLSNKYKLITEICETAIMPKSTKEGYLIAYGTLKTSDVTNFDYTYFIRKLFNLMELSIRMGKSHVGYFVILNCQHFTISHCLKLRLQIIKDAIAIMQDVLPVRVGGVIFVNVPYPLELCIHSMIVPFLNKKIKKRLHISSKGLEFVSEHLDVSLLPKDFGGNEESLNILSDKWYQKERQERQWYINELSQRTDETKRKIKDDQQSNGYFTNIKSYLGSVIPHWKNQKQKN